MSAIPQKSFAGGEIAPALYARTDFQKYAIGLRTCRNMMIMRHGGAANRPGTTFVSPTNKLPTKKVRLIPFIFSTAQTYVVEMGEGYFAFYKNGAQIYDTATNPITAVSAANPCVLTYSGADPANQSIFTITGVAGPMGDFLNGRNFYGVVDNVLNTITLYDLDTTTAIDATGIGAWTSGGTISKVYKITSTYAEAELFDIDFIQSGDVITLVHPSHAPAELSRIADNSWTLANITFAPAQAAPTNPANTGAAGATPSSWVITAVNSETFEESLQSSATTSSATPTAGAPITVSWTAASGAGEYNVYRALNGVYGFIGLAVGTSFSDTGITPDTTNTPPTARNPFSSDFPSAVTYYQQRLTFSNTDNNPEKTWASRSSLYKNFTVSAPTQDDDAVTFTLVGRQVNEIMHLVDMGRLLMFTTGGEWAVDGDQSGILKPGAVNPRQYSGNGSSARRPIIIGGSVLYVQARQSIVRDLGFDFQIDGYRGNDLTIFSSHLVDGYTISDWAYQQTPNSIVWAVRSDGVLLGLTYVPEQQVMAWHRHDLDGGTVESVCVVPEGTEDILYMVVKRTVNSKTCRYVEKMNTRQIGDVEDSIFMDAALSYDGTNTAVTTMTLSGGTDWLYTETLTLTASASFFASTDVGNAIHLTGADGSVIRFLIDAYTSATVVTGRPHKTVPASLRSTAVATWAKAVDDLAGLWHIEGKEVSVFADGFVVANPNDSSVTLRTVSSGKITLDRPYSVIHVGLPIIADLETLDIDQSQGESLADKKKLITRVSSFIENTRGVHVGPKPPTDDATDPLENLTELKIRDLEDYDDPVSLTTESVTIDIKPEWNSNGRIFLRQIDPVPVTILSLVPTGLIPWQGGK